MEEKGRTSYPSDLTDKQWEEITPLYTGMRNCTWTWGKRELTDAVSAVDYVVDLIQTILGVALHAEIINDKQRSAAETGYIVVALPQSWQSDRSVSVQIGHADGYLLRYQRIGDTTREVTFPGTNATPMQIADVPRLHGRPVVNVEICVLHLRASAAIIGE